MNWKRYRRQIAADLPRWTAAGHVSETGADAILADVDARAPASDAAPWLALTGIILGGLALIALIADNWGLIPRLAKLVLLLGLFWAALGGVLWADRRARTWAINGFSVLATLVFLACLGLLGQSLNMSGDPNATLLYGSLAGFAIGLAARSSAAGFSGLVLGAIWFANVSPGFLGLGRASDLAVYDGWTFGLILLGAATAWVCRSLSLLHALLAVSGIYFLSVCARLVGGGPGGLVAALVWAPMVGAFAAARLKAVPGITALSGWAAWHCWIAFAIAGIEFDPNGVIHRAAWLGLSIALLAAGAGLRHAWISAAGIVSLIAAATVLMVDLGVALSLAAIIFAAAAVAAGTLAYIFRRRTKVRP